MSTLGNHVFVIRDAETLKAISDPLRLKIFGLLQDESRTAKELAEELGVAQTRLYYHINLLESLGLIRVSSTRIVAGIIEKHYRASASRISVDRGLFSPGAAPVDTAIEAMLTAILEGVRDAVRESVRDGLADPEHESPAEGGLLLGRRWLRLTRDEAEQFYQQMVGTLKEFEARHENEAREDNVSYEVLLGLYPVTTMLEGTERDDEPHA